MKVWSPVFVISSVPPSSAMLWVAPPREAVAFADTLPAWMMRPATDALLDPLASVKAPAPFVVSAPVPLMPAMLKSVSVWMVAPPLPMLTVAPWTCATVVVFKVAPPLMVIAPVPSALVACVSTVPPVIVGAVKELALVSTSAPALDFVNVLVIAPAPPIVQVPDAWLTVMQPAVTPGAGTSMVAEPSCENVVRSFVANAAGVALSSQ